MTRLAVVAVAARLAAAVLVAGALLGSCGCQPDCADGMAQAPGNACPPTTSTTHAGGQQQ